MYLQNEQHYKI